MSKSNEGSTWIARAFTPSAGTDSRRGSRQALMSDEAAVTAHTPASGSMSGPSSTRVGAGTTSRGSEWEVCLQCQTTHTDAAPCPANQMIALTRAATHNRSDSSGSDGGDDMQAAAAAALFEANGGSTSQQVSLLMMSSDESSDEADGDCYLDVSDNDASYAIDPDAPQPGPSSLAGSGSASRSSISSGKKRQSLSAKYRSTGSMDKPVDGADPALALKWKSFSSSLRSPSTSLSASTSLSGMGSIANRLELRQRSLGLHPHQQLHAGSGVPGVMALNYDDTVVRIRDELSAAEPPQHSQWSDYWPMSMITAAVNKITSSSGKSHLPVPNMPKVFINYAPKDKTFVKTLSERLRDDGVDVWVDFNDNGTAVPEWNDAMLQGLESSENVVFVLTPAWVGNAECLRVLKLALDMNKRVIPILHYDTDGVPMELARYKYVYAVDGQDHMEDVAGNLLAALKLNERYVHDATILGMRHGDWDRNLRPRSLLLRGMDLENAEQVLAEAVGGKEPRPTIRQIEFVRESRRHVVRRNRRRFMALITLLLVALAAVIAAAIVMAVEVTQRNSAVASETAAQVALAQAQADAQAQTALRIQAEAARNASDTARLMASVRSLSASSGSYVKTDPTLAVLAAAEAMRRSVRLDPQERRIAVNALKQVTGSVSGVALYAAAPVVTLSMAPNGGDLYSVHKDGAVLYWNSLSAMVHGAASLEPTRTVFKVPVGRSLVRARFSPDRQFVLLGVALGNSSDAKTGTEAAELIAVELATGRSAVRSLQSEPLFEYGTGSILVLDPAASQFLALDAARPLDIAKTQTAVQDGAQRADAYETGACNDGKVIMRPIRRDASLVLHFYDATTYPPGDLFEMEVRMPQGGVRIIKEALSPDCSMYAVTYSGGEGLYAYGIDMVNRSRFAPVYKDQAVYTVAGGREQVMAVATGSGTVSVLKFYNGFLYYRFQTSLTSPLSTKWAVDPVTNLWFIYDPSGAASLLGAHSSGSLVLWYLGTITSTSDIRNPPPPAVYHRHRSLVTAAAISADTKTLCTAGESDVFAGVWDTTVPVAPDQPSWSAADSGMGRIRFTDTWFAAATATGAGANTTLQGSTVVAWRYPNPRAVPDVAMAPCTTASYGSIGLDLAQRSSGDAAWLVTWCADIADNSAVSLYSVAPSKTTTGTAVLAPVYQFNSTGDLSLHAVATSPSGASVVVGGHGLVLMALTADPAECQQPPCQLEAPIQILPGEVAITAVAVSSTNQVAGIDGAGLLRVWDVPAGATAGQLRLTLASTKQPAAFKTFALSTTWLVVSTLTSSALKVCNLATAECSVEQRTVGLNADVVDMSADGQWVVAASTSGSMMVLRLDDAGVTNVWSLYGALLAQTKPVFSRDGAVLVATAADGSGLLAYQLTDTEISSPGFLSDAVRIALGDASAVAAAPDGSVVASYVPEDQLMRVQAVGNARGLLKTACRIAGRDLSDDEYDVLLGPQASVGRTPTCS